MRLILTSLALALATPAFAAPPPPRPPEDTARDAARKPAEMVAFAKIAPGKTVADIIPGMGYFTRVFAAAVGPSGKVIVVMPPQAETAYPEGAKAIRAMVTGSGGTMLLVPSPADPALAGTLDVAWTAQNYHDLHNGLPPEAVIGYNKMVFAALKPGGYYVVLDHAAVSGSGLAATSTLHRIDPAIVKAEVIAAGFVFDAESTALANPADPHTAIVFDPAMRGKTDQFVYRFRKP